AVAALHPDRVAARLHPPIGALPARHSCRCVLPWARCLILIYAIWTSSQCLEHTIGQSKPRMLAVIGFPRMSISPFAAVPLLKYPTPSGCIKALQNRSAWRDRACAPPVAAGI